MKRVTRIPVTELQLLGNLLAVTEDQTLVVFELPPRRSLAKPFSAVVDGSL
jgi:hypothetical protein